MPGLVGLITDMPRPRAEALVRRMLAAVHHEPFYESRIAIDERRGVYVGCCTREPSTAGPMPQRNGAGDMLAFSGEDFSRPADERASLLERAVDEPCFPASLNGRFHGLLIRGHGESAILFNDRYGLHRIYYHEGREGLYFAAEAKALLEVCPDLTDIDLQGLAEYVACGCVLENRTLFTRIRVLPPAAAWSCRAGKVERKDSYFNPATWEQQPPLEPEPYYERLRHAFATSLPRYFSGPARVAVSMTGGFDTRIIMAWHQAPAGTLPCYTFGGAARTSHDVRVARQVALLRDQPHHVIRVGREFLESFADYAERTIYLTDGCADVSRSADLYVNRIARRVAPVRMTGNYGSEVLRRVRAFKPVTLMRGLFAPELAAQLPRASRTYGSVLRGHPLSFAVFRQAPWHHYGLLALEESQLSVRTPYLDNEFVATLFRAPERAVAGSDVSVRLIADGDPRLLDVETDRAVQPRRPESSSIGRAVREFSFKAEYAYDYGMPQWLARIDHALAPLRLERLFLGRHKFYHYRVWYRDALARFVRDTLLDSVALSRPYVERRTVEAIVNGHLRGGRNHTLEIHRLLTLELFHRLFVDRRPVRRSTRVLIHAC